MKRLTSIFALAHLLLLTLFGHAAWATAVDVSTPRFGVPPNITTSSNRPMLMLATSKDHSLFGPIYTDFEDLEGDGTINTTFQPTFKYYGYFDATKCYVYANTRFEPNALATAGGPAATATLSGSITGQTFTDTSHGSGTFTIGMQLTGIGVEPNTYIISLGTGTGANSGGTYTINNDHTTAVTSQTITGVGSKYTCGGPGQWSGNFLNWATMTRMDVVRKLLYGGKRSTDSVTLTVLERANLSKDSHSFTKHYMGTDIRDYTPFTVANLTKTTGDNINTYAGLTICSRSDTMGEGGVPVIRLAKGNYRMWSTVEGTVCEWGAGQLGAKLASYFRDTGKGQGSVAHESVAPTTANDGATYSGIGPELTLRVKVCDAALLGEERCQAFPPSSTTNYKPYGLFQEFGFSATGDAARAEFGVLTGSYDKNLTAGALRKNMGDFADEINASTGVFCHAASAGCPANTTDGRTTTGGAIKALDALLLFGRSSGNYTGSNVQLPSELTDGTLPAWGNPIGEMIIQSFQYYAGLTSTNPSPYTNDTAKGLPVVAWTDPLSNTNTVRKGLYGNSVCRPMYSMALSSSATSFDMGGAAPFAGLPNRGSTGNSTLADFTNAIGTAENLSSGLKSVGSIVNPPAFGETCSGKAIGNLSDVTGVCPDAPGIGGTYGVAGAAFYANTNKIRTIASPPSDITKVQDALKVKTLAASLSGGAARIDVLIPNSNPKEYVYITPESLWASNSNGKKMPGALLTLNSIAYRSYITTTASAIVQTGTFMVTWNDSLFGGDYDMDIAGFIRYDVRNPSAAGQKYTIEITTDIVNVGAGWSGTHGFSILGVTKRTDNSVADGRYLTHRHLNNATILNGSQGYLCENATYSAGGVTAFNGIHDAPTTRHCDTSVDGNNVRGPTTARVNGPPVVEAVYSPVVSKFNMVGAGTAIVKDPLWYAAKYGSFTSSIRNSDGTYSEVLAPSSVSSWDKKLADGSAGSDGVPDAYFLARRPDLLEQQLRQALDSLAKNSNAAPAVSSSQLITEGLKYVAKFDSTTVEGNIEAYKVDNLGYFSTTPTWRAGQLLQIRTSAVPAGDNGNSRKIITNNGNASSAAATTSGGFAYRWASLPAGYKTLMTTSSTNQLSTTNASLVVDYMRGDQTKENASTGLRVRTDNILGPVVNATPWIQSPPVAYFSEYNFPGYRAFAATNKARAKLLWVSANDGMLHAFNPKADPADGGGSEVFAYVPGSLANRLAELPLQRGTAGRTRYNGANFTLDAAETLPQGTVWPYVDGSPFTGDICLTTGTTCDTWKTYVFSTLGRGGKAIFALDATDLTKLTDGEAGTNPADIFKWQFTSDDDTDLGYVVNDVSTSSTSGQASPIVKLNNGKFAIMIGNGQKSSSGKAALFLLFVDGPSASNGSWTGRYTKIVADSGSGNGLSTPTWVDLDGNGTADIAYAGDLKGNMWKFDLTSATSSNWDVFYKSGSTNKPLITAKDGSTALPITTAPEIVYPPFNGLIVAFGTGNAFESVDFPKNSVTQRIYGVWDRPDFDGASPIRALPTNLSTLVSRTFARQTDGSVVVSGTPQALDWATNDGWYVNLPGTSEMVLSDPIMRAGVLTATSVRPKSTIDNCSDTPSVSLFTFDPLSGKGEKIIQGTTDVAGVITINVGRDIDDQKVRTVNDRTVKAHTTECRAGDPGCFCADAACTKYEKGTSCSRGSANCFCPTANDNTCHIKGKPTCTPGQSVMRVIGQGTDASLCYTVNARTQWREVPGLRTDQ